VQRLTIFSRAVSAAWSARSVRPARVSAVLTAMLIVAGAVSTERQTRYRG